MPRVTGFTEKQKMESGVKTRVEQIRKGLYGYMGMNGLSAEKLGERIGVCHVTVAKLLRGESVRLTCEQWLRIVSFVGMSIVQKEVSQ